MRSFLRALTFTVFALASCAALAETKPAPGKPAAQAPQTKQELETVQLVGLIKSTIMALQHANQTGNYSVLRDLGTPVFRERFDQAQLAAIFSNLHSRGVSLSPVLFLAPNLTKQPELTAPRGRGPGGRVKSEPLGKGRAQYAAHALPVITN